MKYFFIFLVAPLFFVRADPTTCAQGLKTKTKLNLRIGEKFCKKAEAAHINLQDFENCIIHIHSDIEVAPEIISPYCLRRYDVAYQECVIEKHKLNVRENPFKLCLKKNLRGHLWSPERTIKNIKLTS